MLIKRFTIQSFGKIHNQTFELSPGINVLYGENESGKTTIHTFIKSMFYGIRRQRGKAAQNDIYNTYEPWNNPAEYGGCIWFEENGKSYRLNRNFYKQASSCELYCESDGSLLDVEEGALEELLGEVSEVVYDNTVSVGQLKSVTGQDLVRELQNYMASYQGTGDSAIDLGRASQMLKMSRKGYQTQAEKRRKELEQTQNNLLTQMNYLGKELKDLESSRNQILQKKKTLHMDDTAGSGEQILEDKIRMQGQKCKLMLLLMSLGLILGIGATVALSVLFGFLPLGVISFIVAVLLGGVCGTLYMKAKREFHRKKRVKAKWLAQQEKLNWNWETLEEAYIEKKTNYKNLKEEYDELEERRYMPLLEEQEVEAINLAMKAIEDLSGNMNHHMGDRLRNRMGEILSQITDGKYQEISIDRNLEMMVNTQDRLVPLARLSRGTMEQIYFALRMAAGELLCGQKAFPVILDDVFGMYDEDRLMAVLRWLHKEHKQIIISTCNKREMDLLDKAGIPYQKITGLAH